MWTLLFSILMLMVFGRLLTFAVRAAWGLSKIIVTIILIPLLLVGLVFMGMIWLALPLLIIIGVISLFVSAF